MLSKFKRNKHQQHLAQLPKISQSVDDVDFFYAPADFRETLLEKIASAKQRICIVALYLEQDDGGKGILNALYEAKRQRPVLLLPYLEFQCFTAELSTLVSSFWYELLRG